jgi:hypothetical protein
MTLLELANLTMVRTGERSRSAQPVAFIVGRGAIDRQERRLIMACVKWASHQFLAGAARRARARSHLRQSG